MEIQRRPQHPLPERGPWCIGDNGPTAPSPLRVHRPGTQFWTERPPRPGGQDAQQTPGPCPHEPYRVSSPKAGGAALRVP